MNFIRKEVLALTRRVEAQRALKALIEATKDNQNFDAVKKQNQNNKKIDKTNKAEEKSALTLNIVDIYMNLRGTQPMAGAVQDTGNSTTLNGYAGARMGRCQRMMKGGEQFTTHAKIRGTKGW